MGLETSLDARLRGHDDEDAIASVTLNSRESP